MAQVMALPVYKTRRTAAVKATVYPEKGEPYTGYIIGGRTYKDPQGDERIEYNSRVETPDGRRYVYTRETGGVPDQNTAQNEYARAHRESVERLRSSRAANDRAIDLGVSQNVRALRADRDAAERDMYAANKQARRAYIEASSPFGAIAQQTHALGLGDSGFAESTRMGLANEYQAALSAARSGRDAAVREIDAAITRAISQGEMEKARAWAELEGDIFAADEKANENLADMRNRAAESARDDEKWEREWAREQEEITYGRMRDALKDALERSQAEEKAEDARFERALALAKLGVSSQEIASALGITRAQADGIAYRATAKSSGAKKASSKASGDSAEMEKRAETLRAEIEAFLKRNDITDQAGRARAYLYGVSYAIATRYIPKYVGDKILGR